MFALVSIVFSITISILFAILSVLFPEFVPQMLKNSQSNANISAIFMSSAIIGFVSALMSLALSRIMAKWTMGLKPIQDGQYQTEAESFVFETVKRQMAHFSFKMPEVALYDSAEVNAFATGPTKNRSLVAVSTGLIHAMSQREIEAVIAHELSHIDNGDMVTMTLIQGLVNTFVLSISRFISNLASNEGLRFALYIGCQMLLGFLAIPITSYFSRIREYAADAGSARVVGKEAMIAALQRLEAISGHDETELKNAALGINNKRSKMGEWFSTHPTMQQRIESLKNLTV